MLRWVSRWWRHEHTQTQNREKKTFAEDETNILTPLIWMQILRCPGYELFSVCECLCMDSYLHKVSITQWVLYVVFFSFYCVPFHFCWCWAAIHDDFFFISFVCRAFIHAIVFNHTHTITSFLFSLLLLISPCLILRKENVYDLNTVYIHIHESESKTFHIHSEAMCWQ